MRKWRPSDLSRRDFMLTSAAGLTISATLPVVAQSPDPAVQNKPPGTLTALEYQTASALADVLVPGAKDAGVGIYLDNQLGHAVGDCLLMIRYLGVPDPYINFYRDALANVQNACVQIYEHSFAELSADQQLKMARDIATDDVEGWKGTPASFFHFVLRADAADILYGTMAGFQRLDIPYLAHIEPTSNW